MFDDIISSIYNKEVETYDQFLEKALEPYGINRQNIAETADRVMTIRRHSITDSFRSIEDFFIDERYAFSVHKILRYEERAPGVMAMVMDIRILKGENDEHV